MKLLIFGTTYPYSKQYQETVGLAWYKFLSRCEDLSQCYLCMVDSGSQLSWDGVFPVDTTVYNLPTNQIGDAPAPSLGQIQVVRFPNNIGHYCRDTKPALPEGVVSHDGGGRAFCQGMHLACQWGMDYFVHVEMDCVLMGDKVITKQIQAMQKAGKTWSYPKWGGGCETNLILGTTTEAPWFIETYNWNKPKINGLMENLVHGILTGKMTPWNLPGGRGKFPSQQDVLYNKPYHYTANGPAAQAPSAMLLGILAPDAIPPLRPQANHNLLPNPRELPVLPALPVLDIEQSLPIAPMIPQETEALLPYGIPEETQQPKQQPVVHHKPKFPSPFPEEAEADRILDPEGPAKPPLAPQVNEIRQYMAEQVGKRCKSDVFILHVGRYDNESPVALASKARSINSRFVCYCNGDSMIPKPAVSETGFDYRTSSKTNSVVQVQGAWDTLPDWYRFGVVFVDGGKSCKVFVDSIRDISARVSNGCLIGFANKRGEGIKGVKATVDELVQTGSWQVVNESKAIPDFIAVERVK